MRMTTGTRKRRPSPSPNIPLADDHGRSPAAGQFFLPWSITAAKNPHQFHTLEVAEPSTKHLKISPDGRTGYIHVKGLPRLTFNADHRLPTDQQPAAIRITQTPRRLNVCLVFNRPAPIYQEPANHAVGIDPGQKYMVTAVNDADEIRQIPGIDDRQHRKTKRRLQRKAQRQRNIALKEGRAKFVSHRNWNGTVKRRFRWTDRPSNNYLRTLAQLRRVEQKGRDSLNGLQHRITSKLVKDHQVICLEDTRSANMTRSAKGTLEQPGSNVRQKSGLNRAILAQNWGKIRSQLEYKCYWYDRTFVTVPAPNTSKACSQCGSISKGNRRSQSIYVYKDCGYDQNADVNAAINIRHQGLTSLARAENPPGRAAGNPDTG